MVALNTPFDREICAVCGRDVSGGPSFMRVYLERGRLEFCSPACAHQFTDAPTRFGGEPPLVERPWSEHDPGVDPDR